MLVLRFGIGRSVPLFTCCCPPLLMLACRAKTTGEFLIAASVSTVALDWLCTFRASRM